MSDPSGTTPSGVRPSPSLIRPPTLAAPAVPALATLTHQVQAVESRLGTVDQCLATMALRLNDRMTLMGSEIGTALNNMLTELALLKAPGAVQPNPQELPPQPSPPMGDATPLETHLVAPPPFDGDLERCAGFLSQCALIFRFHPRRYPTDAHKVAYIISLLRGQALQWVTTLEANDSPLLSDYSSFRETFRRMFQHPTKGRDCASRLMEIKQGARSVAVFTLEFRLLAAQVPWNDHFLRAAYRRGLNHEIKDEIMHSQPADLEALVDLALLTDDRIQDRRADRHRAPAPTRPAPGIPGPTTPRSAPGSSPLSPATGEPMEIGRNRLSPAVREARMKNRLCLYCGESNHMIRSCPSRPNASAP